MPRIERYTRGIVKQRATSRLVNESAISDAGSTFNGISDIASGVGAGLDKWVAAKETVAVNEAVIKNKKQKMEFIEQARQENMSTPEDFEKRMEVELGKIDSDMESSLPTGRSKKAFRSTAQDINMTAYAQNFDWAKNRQLENFAESVENTSQDISMMSFRRGLGDIDDLIKDAEATIVAGSTFVAPEKIDDMRTATFNSVVSSNINAHIQDSPKAVLNALNSQKYDKYLTPDYIRSATIQANNRIKQITNEARQAKLVKAMTQSYLEEGKVKADPANKDHREALDAAYQESGLAERIQELDIDAMSEVLDNIRQTTIIPETLQSTMRGLMFNGTQEERAYAYKFIGSVQQINPQALEQAAGFTQKERSAAEDYNAFVRSGSTPEFAMRAIEDARNPLTQDVRSLRESQANELMKNINESTIIGIKDFDDNPIWFMGHPSAIMRDGNNMQAGRAVTNYNKIFREAYLQYGDVTQAKNKAEAAITTSMGATDVTGSRMVMDYAPEDYYNEPLRDPLLGVTKADMTKAYQGQLQAQISAKLGSVPTNYFLQPAVNTARRVEMNLKPQYNVWFENDKTGELDMVRDEMNNPYLASFDENAVIDKFKNKYAKKQKIAGKKTARYKDIESESENMYPSDRPADSIRKFVRNKLSYAAASAGVNVDSLEPVSTSTNNKMKSQRYGVQ